MLTLLRSWFPVMFSWFRRVARPAFALCFLVALTTAFSACCREQHRGGPGSFRQPDGGGAETASPADSAPPGAVPEVPPGGDRRRDIARRVGRQRVDPNGPQFAAPALLTAHFKKHGEEMGFVNESDYLAAAQTLIGRTDTLYFRGETGEFAVKTERGIIRTYFLPGNPRSYWDRQKRGTEGEEDGETDLRKRLRR